MTRFDFLRCSLIALSSATFFTTFCVPVASAEPPVPKTPKSAAVSASTFENDPRLERAITIEETSIPFNELLARYSEQKLELKAARNCAEQKFQIRLKQRPLRVLMQAIAEMMPGAWVARKDGSGYYFEMSVRATTWRDEWWQLFLNERKKAESVQRAYLLDQMRQNPFAGLPPSPESDPEAHAQVTAGNDFFRALPTALQEQLANSQTGCPLFTAGMAVFGTHYDEGSLLTPISELPPAMQNTLRQRCAGIFLKDASSVDMSGAMLRLLNGGFALDAGVIFPDGRDIGSAFMANYDFSPHALPIIADPSRLGRAVDRMGDAAPDEWKKLVKAARNRVWKNNLPAKVSAPYSNARRPELLTKFGQSANLEYVADYYSLGGLMMPESEKTQPLKRPIPEELNEFALARNTSWKQAANGIYLFRHNLWHWLDHTEIPAPTLRRLLAQREKLLSDASGTPSARPPMNPIQKMQQMLTWNTEVVNGLTIWQITSGFAWFTPQDDAQMALLYHPIEFKPTDFFGDPILLLRMKSDALLHPFKRDGEAILIRYATFQFYADLNDTQRAALHKGELVLSELSQAQKQQAIYLLPTLTVMLQQKEASQIALGLLPKAEVFKPGMGIGLTVMPH